MSFIENDKMGAFLLSFPPVIKKNEMVVEIEVNQPII
jgi:hypothetical protein